ncbi:uncharacterized protein LOC124134993 isoform X2 [Haliotis rufescens]|uniref:uncharacterized protein LOC124134993 isoform X2 n=1 Tax=Haliotis rufescens TaxID=6454 RepID=UPI00201F1479|nr:uncharacterized protein LOC124134993 isoform X2 [Haliotis rufescens]
MATIETDAAPEPTFNALLMEIASHIATDDLNALKYMFKDLLPPNKLDKISDALGIFTPLKEKRLIQHGKTLLLTQAFLKIGRNDLLPTLQQIGPEDDRDGTFPDGTVSPVRLALFEIAQNLTPEEVEKAKFYFGDIIGKQKQGKIKNAFDLLTVLEQLKPTNFMVKLETFLGDMDRMDLVSDLKDFRKHNDTPCNLPSRTPRGSTQEVHRGLDAEYASAAPKSGGAAPHGSDAKKATSNKLFPGALGKGNYGIDVEKASDMRLLDRAAESVCSIKTNGTGFMVGDGCIMTAAHVLKEALGITDEEIRKLQETSSTQSEIQKRLVTNGLSVLFTHEDNVIRVFQLKTLRYVNIQLDTAVVELAPSMDGKFPQAFTRFLSNHKGFFNFLGHTGGLTLYRDHNCYTITEEYEFKKMKIELLKSKIPPELLNVYDTFGKNPSFLQFHCSLTYGASGSPGVVVEQGEVRVLTMLLARHPVIPDNIHIDPKLCVEQGVTMKAIYEDMKTADPQLHWEIYGTS